MTHRGLAQPKALAGARYISLLHDRVEDNEQIEVECTQFHAGALHANLHIIPDGHISMKRMHFHHAAANPYIQRRRGRVICPTLIK